MCDAMSRWLAVRQGVNERRLMTREQSDDPAFDPQMLIDIARMEMPFGRYQGRRLIDLPEPYVVWFRKNGFPRGRLGLLMGLLYEIKANGLEHLVRPLGEGGQGTD